ncbi:hypothetical protein [Streptomyces coffeae]|uniref:Uncharacterized protein n=1 Tax=Streptomyces coffeae TaxID=621382 RepID=A0ABS1N9A3_9ACTN|nr:hypothetical protein [Streptomyces coffeae]MBL1096416.1 hypothetical protein [Streptomyces coffeae]
MSHSQYAAPAAAAQALRAAERARLRASTPEPTPAWWAPTAALTHAVGLTLTAGPWTYASDGAVWRTVLGAVGIVALAVFPAMCVLRVRRMKVIAWPPPGTTRQRTVREGTPLAAYGLGWVVYLAVGWAAGAITGGALGGAALWWRETRKNRLIAEAEARLSAPDPAGAGPAEAGRTE